MPYHSLGMPPPETAIARPAIIVVMGVSGSGKTTVARLLAEQLSCSMLEGDSLHSAENIRRMAAGTALGDSDRGDWLASIAQRIAAASRDGRALVVSCSALKRRYRDILRQAEPRLLFVHLTGSKGLIRQRLSQRHDHFMSPALLDSQFDALELPGLDELVISADIAQSPARIVASVLARLPSSAAGHAL
ncbi:MAG TPA: gluconokinase [Steroidobacteraceae bacterium]|nr:gluconokinase [Steroidobacteraceae bacterium]